MPPEKLEERTATRLSFLNREAAEVYLLLDFLSGRADRSLRPTSNEQANSLLQEQLHLAARAANSGLGAGEKAPQNERAKVRQQIEEDLQDPTLLVLRTMGMNYPIAEHDKDFEANAAFLIRARDVLNARAAPATGASIAFTSMVAARGSRPGTVSNVVSTREFAETAYPGLQLEAKQLKAWISRWRWVLVGVLLLTIVVSAYTACGKVMLDTLDAVRRDGGAVQKELGAVPKELEAFLRELKAATAAEKTPPAIGQEKTAQANAQEKPRPCTKPSENPAVAPVSCYPTEDLRLRNEVTHNNMALWLFQPSLETDTGVQADWKTEATQKAVGQWAVVAMAILGNYFMPILYGFLGSLAFVLRRYYDRLAAQILSPRDLHANKIRLLLGTLIGGSIGLVYSGTGTSQATGTLGLAVTLSTSAFAFLAGYGVEGVFKTLDALIAHVFRVNGTEKATEQTAGK
ncbi:MAG: hypothetical protein EXR07_08835 [Acetobacteraceae bacterium]|nr:hypothetical protein [Acetobacteraceae bacterium]